MNLPVAERKIVVEAGFDVLAPRVVHCPQSELDPFVRLHSRPTMTDLHTVDSMTFPNIIKYRNKKSAKVLKIIHKATLFRQYKSSHQRNE
jgi:hypothetical protein